MGWNKVNTRGKIGGFWTRDEGSQVVGQVKKYVETDNGGFFIIQLTEAGTPLQGPKEGGEGRDAKMGECIGVSGSAATECLKEFENQGLVKLTSRGKKKDKKGNEFWAIEVEHDPSGKPYKGPEINYNSEDIPF